MTEGRKGDGETTTDAALSNQSRLREKLAAGTLAKRLADAYDAGESTEVNRDALKQVVEDELDKVRSELEQDENQVD